MSTQFVNQMTIRIGGEAGHGVKSSGAGFCKALTRAGLYVFGLPDYYSRIRGGHNFYSIRISDKPLYSHAEPIHLLLALTSEAIDRHLDQIVSGGAVLYDTSVVKDDILRRENIRFVGLPMSDMAKETAGTVLARNTLALGFAAGITGLDLEPLNSVIRDNFKRKGDPVVAGNLAVALAGYEHGMQHASTFSFKLRAILDAPPRMVMNGTQAFSMGALAGGCRFASSYPMTPGSPALHWFAAHAEEYGAVIKHTEDEIAGICMAVGAAHMGVRAFAPTSGGGFSLMVEALGMAGANETPVVIYNAQRPGPATGLPTRQEQGDLLFSLYASQGEFGRFILAPITHESCFEAGWRAFNLAERCQTPALVLSDHYLAVAVRTLDMSDLDFDAVEIDRGELLSEADLDALEGAFEPFKLTESGVSPRALPGNPNAVYTKTSSEHWESGAVTEEPAMRIAQVDKRARKMQRALSALLSPASYGPPGAELTFVCWGSTYGPLREAVDRINALEPGAVNMVAFSDLWPLPKEKVLAALSDARQLVNVEVNSTGQLALLLRSSAGAEMDHNLLKYDGRAFTPEYIVNAWQTGLG